MLSFGSETTNLIAYRQYSDKLDQLLEKYIPALNLVGSCKLTIPQAEYDEIFKFFVLKEELSKNVGFNRKSSKVKEFFQQFGYQSPKGFAVIVGDQDELNK